MKKIIAVITTLLMLFLSAACSKGSAPNGQTTMPSTEDERVVVEFDFKEQSGHASNQFAVWVEDTKGNLIKTLYATHYTANGGYKNRPDSVPVWVTKSELSSMDKKQIDAISGATPKTGMLHYYWDLTDNDGKRVSPDKYTILVEGTLRWKNQVLFSAEIDLSEIREYEAIPTKHQAHPEYTYEATDSQEALTSDSPENAMIENVAVSYVVLRRELPR